LDCRTQIDLKILFYKKFICIHDIRWIDNVRIEELLQGVKQEKNIIVTLKGK